MTPACRHFTNRSQAEERKDTPKPEEAEEKPVDPKNHEGEEAGLTKEDIQKIKKLIADQDDQIEKLTAQVEKLKNEY